MRLRRALRPSLRALLAHRVRAALVLSSVATGVAAVLLTAAVGKGAERELARTLEALGTDLLVVRPAAMSRFPGRRQVRGTVTSLEVGDAEAIAELALVREAAPSAEGMLRVKAGKGALLTMVLGTSPAFPAVRRFRLREGRFFGPADDRESRRVAVLGARVGETLFPGESPVGRQIRLRSVPFEVIGVLEAKGAQADGADEDTKVVIPLRTALRRVFNTSWLSNVFVSVRDPARMAEAEAEIGELLRARHRRGREGAPDDFAVQDRTRFLAGQQETVEFLTLLTTGLAGLALSVGGTGILALMLLSVRERTGETGLRMAVGARPRDILLQFLLEATVLALGGWAIGVAAGALAAGAVAFGTDWKVGVPVRALLASLAMAVTTGVGFGAFPARKASLLPPTQALATE